ncbi:MAG: sulfite exporter TauE/SafE family protein [Proteobacteria bacterium]|nr:sulfite exporter TauE/SafE family protein [Pseudomonadota bacterium]
MIFGVTPFETISIEAAIGLGAIYFLAFLLRGLIGFGSSTPAIIGGAWILPPHDAVLLAVLASLFAQIQLLPKGFKTCDRTIIRPMVAGVILSMVLGVWIFANLKAEWLTIVIGAALVIAVLAEHFKLTEKTLADTDLRRFRVPFTVTSVSGVLSGVSGVGANFLVSVFVRWATPNPVTFRGTLLVFSGFTGLWRAIVTLLAGLFTVQLFIESVFLLPSIFLGGWAGLKLGDVIDGKRYAKIIQTVLVLAAISLVWKGARALLETGPLT